MIKELMRDGRRLPGACGSAAGHPSALSWRSADVDPQGDERLLPGLEGLEVFLKRLPRFIKLKTLKIFK